ncbi:MAG: alpha-galactosidase [Bacteroidaceae bacterium]|nr:alpha-galactosidase [Bacteroidaceae bacterium]
MKHPFVTLFLLLVTCVAQAQGTAAEAAESKAPTMGWSSWNSFGVNISESIIKRQALLLYNKYKRYGYRYVNIDDGYFGGRDEADGHLLIHPTRFPNGMQPVVDYIHGKGLKAGIYSDAGHNTCGSMFNGDVIGKGVGLYTHDQQDCDLFFRDLGFDFIKVDFCGGSYFHNEDHLVLDEQERYTAIWQAMQNTGRTDLRLNVCRWAFPGTWVHNVATSWRTTGDINCSWGSVKGILKENFNLSAYATDGRFNDMDMLEVGRGLSTEEDQTHFGMWCIMASPLLIGCDLEKVSTTAYKLMTNPDLIALNQDSLYLQAYVVKRDGEAYTLVKDIEQRNGLVRAVALCNLGDEDKEMTLTFADVDLDGPVAMRDLCAKKDIAEPQDGAFTVTVPAHGTRIYRLQAERRLERTLYEAETAYLSAYQELQNNQALPSGIYEENDNCSGGAKAGWLGKSATNDLQWRNVYSPTGGKYTMTLRYLCGESRSVTLEVNGKKHSTASLNSGGFDKIGSKVFTIELQKGDNVIRLYNATGWMPDIDGMTLTLKSLPASIVTPKPSHRTQRFNLHGQRFERRATSSIVVTDGRVQVAQ